MIVARFIVGDRVRIRTPRFVPVGTTGTIAQVVRSIWGTYYVQFDNQPQPRLMHTHDLEHVKDEAPQSRRATAKG